MTFKIQFSAYNGFSSDRGKKKSVTMKDNDRQRSIRIKMFRLSEYMRHRPTDKNTEQVNR